ncbi:MAG: aminoacyl-tRNA hydrolase [Candidatus Omnitrophica bacterium]|nr:aminoacyl-tRNA hydrolase [Candidatus Omnitrophota bacterium]
MTRDQARLIVGLGNPGGDYEYTRHNLGFLVVDRLARKNGLDFRKSSFANGLMAQDRKETEALHCFLPTTYMNNSGLAVKQAVAKLGLDIAHLLIVCDDLNLGFGQVRLRGKGSDGGHNGLASVFEHLGTRNIARLRLGIGAPRPAHDRVPRLAHDRGTVDYVLGEFTKEEKSRLDEFIDRATDCCEVWLKEGIRKAMDQFNGKS